MFNILAKVLYWITFCWFVCTVIVRSTGSISKVFNSNEIHLIDLEP